MDALPRDNLFRTLSESIELRSAEGDGGMPTLAGHFSVFDQWTEINSMWEGRFMERIAPGAFKKTIRENKAGMRVLFQHGQDPQLGDKVLGPIQELREDDFGAYYEVPLLDTSYNRDLLPGLEAGLYGASFRFRVMREDIVDEPEPSDSNPRGLPERTIREAQVREFGPVTWGAYENATAGVRSITDDYIFQRFLAQPDRLRALLSTFLPAAIEEGREEEESTHEQSAETESHPPVVRRSIAPLFGLHREETPAWRL